MQIQRVGVIGAGVIGTGVAQDLAQTGHDVILVDVSDGILERARDDLARNIRFHHLVSRGAERQNVTDVMARIVLTTDHGQLAAADYLEALEAMHGHGRALAAWWEDGFDLLLTPTTAMPPPPLGTFAPEPGVPLAGYLRAGPYGTYTAQFNMSGQPGVSLPLYWNDEGLPIGVHLVAAAAREDLLIRVAAQLEAADPWAAKLPSLHASRV